MNVKCEETKIGEAVSFLFKDKFNRMFILFESEIVLVFCLLSIDCK